MGWHSSSSCRRDVTRGPSSPGCSRQSARRQIVSRGDAQQAYRDPTLIELYEEQARGCIELAKGLRSRTFARRCSRQPATGCETLRRSGEQHQADRRRRHRTTAFAQTISAIRRLSRALTLGATHGAEARALAADPYLAGVGNRCGGQTDLHCLLRVVLLRVHLRDQRGTIGLAPSPQLFLLSCST
jgi:hypothetical protein